MAVHGNAFDANATSVWGHRLRKAARYSREEEIIDLQKRRFDEIRSSFESLFDTMITNSRSTWDALKRTFLSVFLTPVKQQLSMLVAGMFSGRAGGGGGGGFAGALSGIGGMFESGRASCRERV